MTQVQSGNSQPIRPLQGKKALVTGGSRGIGRGIVLALARQGCAVAIHYARQHSAAELTAEQAATLGVPVALVRANLAKEEEAAHIADRAADQLDGLDILVANAATGVLKPITDLAQKDWDWTIDVNARSVLLAAQQAAVYMRANSWGRIITITSVGSRRVHPQYSMVGISKAALEAMTRYLAAELAPFGICANCVSPGLVLTGALDHFPQSEAMIDYARRHTPAGRLVTPEDVGAVIAWLCSDQAAMIVGQTIEVDGGYGLMMLG